MRVSRLVYLFSSFFLFLLFLFPLASAVSAQTYSLEALPLELGPRSYINNNNQIVGKNYLWQDASLSALPELPNTTKTQASDINNNGVIAGFTDVSPGYQHVLTWQNGNITDIGLPEGMLRCSYPQINDTLQLVVGCDDVNQGGAYLWENGNFTKLNEGFGTHDINNNGQIVGYRVINNNLLPVIWENSILTDLSLPENETSCYAISINDNEQLGINCNGEGANRTAYLWNNGLYTQVIATAGATSTEIYDINNHGHIVGGTNIPSNPSSLGQGFVWKNGQATILDLVPGDAYGTATAINDNGWIVGSTVANFVKKTVLWKPVEERQLTQLDPAQVWISKGLLNFNARLDLRAEAYVNDSLVSSGQITNEAVGTGRANQATLETIPFTSFSPVDFPEGSQLKITLFVKKTCTNQNQDFGNARIWFNTASLNSHFGATVDETASTYFLRENFVLSETQGAGPRQSITKQTHCNQFEPFGTWAVSP